MSNKPRRDEFPRLLSDQELETAIRDRWFREHNRDDAVYALQGSDFTDAIEDWIRKSFPDHAKDAVMLAGLIWLNHPVLDHQRRVSSSWSGFFKRLMTPRGELKHRWDTESDE
jgi:hypothetical protein